MKLELKSIKHFASGSEETFCYTAKLYADGEHVADVSNSGQGGCDMQHMPRNFKGGGAAWRENIDAVRAYCESLPDVIDQRYGPLEMNLEFWCSLQVGRMVETKRLKRIISRRAMVFTDGIFLEYKTPWTAGNADKYREVIRKKYPSAVILNELPFADALDLFIENG